MHRAWIRVFGMVSIEAVDFRIRDSSASRELETSSLQTSLQEKVSLRPTTDRSHSLPLRGRELEPRLAPNQKPHFRGVLWGPSSIGVKRIWGKEARPLWIIGFMGLL